MLREKELRNEGTYIPFYNYKCKKCDKHIDVLRSFDEYEKSPTEQELGEEAYVCDHDWEREIGGNQTLTRGPNWSGRKGAW